MNNLNRTSQLNDSEHYRPNTGPSNGWQTMSCDSRIILPTFSYMRSICTQYGKSGRDQLCGHNVIRVGSCILRLKTCMVTTRRMFHAWALNQTGCKAAALLEPLGLHPDTCHMALSNYRSCCFWKIKVFPYGPQDKLHPVTSISPVLSLQRRHSIAQYRPHCSSEKIPRSPFCVAVECLNYLALQVELAELYCATYFIYDSQGHNGIAAVLVQPS